MKKTLIMVVAIVLVAALAVGGTFAYLTSTDEDVNVATVGNVEIKQIEQQKNDDGSIGAFEQGKDFYPGSELSKIVSVKNTGASDAYFRTLIAFEDVPGSNTFGIGFPISESYTWDWFAPGATFELNGSTYQVYEAVYKKALEPGETSPASLTKVELAETATNEDMEVLGETYDILVLSQAVQTVNFTDAKTALDEAFGELTDAKAAEWFGGMVNFEFVGADGDKYAVEGEEAEAILGYLNEGKDLIVDKDVDIIEMDTTAVDAKGATVTLAGQGEDAYGYLAFVPKAGEDVTVKNLNVTGAGFVEIGHYGLGGGDYVAENLKIEDLASTLANGDKGFILGCAFCHYGNAVLNNCVMTGATSVRDDYDVLAVDAGFVNDTTTVVNGGKYGTVYCWSHALVTLNGAEIDTLYVAPIKGTVTINAGTKIDTLNVAHGTSAASENRLAKLVIEDGATVGKIVFSDLNNTAKTFNTVAEWNEFVAANF